MSVSKLDPPSSLPFVERRSPLLEGEAARGSGPLASSLFQQLSRSGRNRAEMLEFVNCLLGLVAQSRGRAQHLLVDAATGFPTRRALVELLGHQLDPAQQDAPPHILALYQAKAMADPMVFARVVRRLVRDRDVVVPLDENRVAVVIGCDEVQGERVVARTLQSLGAALAPFQVTPRAVLIPLRRGDPVRKVLKDVFQRLKGPPMLKLAPPPPPDSR